MVRTKSAVAVSLSTCGRIKCVRSLRGRPGARLVAGSHEGATEHARRSDVVEELWGVEGLSAADSSGEGVLGMSRWVGLWPGD